jgi:lipid II:glycine glycyltransferase (peptidoglycan interpeptide bridge formation enzyme)
MIPDLASRIRLNFGERFKVGYVTLDNEMIGAQSLLCDFQNSIVHFAPGGYSTTKNIHSPAIYVNWKIIEWASEAGLRYVNFGPALPDPSNSIYRSKQKFGGQFVEGYRFKLPIANSPPFVARTLGRGFRRVKRAFQRIA